MLHPDFKDLLAVLADGLSESAKNLGESAQRVIELHRNSVPPRSASDIAELVIAAIDSVALTRARDDEIAGPRH